MRACRLGSRGSFLLILITAAAVLGSPLARAVEPAAVAAKNATSTIPIVVALVGDPIRSGLAASLARPGGNLTGLSGGFTEGFAGKWLELLQETVPRLSTLAVIENPDTAIARDLAKELEVIAPTRGLKFRLIEVRDMARRVATYVDKILRGAKPAELPVEEISTYKLIIDQRVAREMGIELRQELLLRADEVIR